MWNVIVEKAWAKVKGSYENSASGHLLNGMRAITGNPGFSYGETEDVDATFEMLRGADELGYLMAISTLDTGSYD